MSNAQTVNDLGSIQLGTEVFVAYKNKILLIQRSPTAKRFPGFWVAPGGHVDSTEDYLTAAIREVFEETGVQIDPQRIKLKVLEIHYHVDKQEVWTMPIFLARLDKLAKNTSSSEGPSRWFDIEEAKNLNQIFPPCKYYFDHILNDRPGILYTNIYFENSQIIKVNSHVLDSSS